VTRLQREVLRERFAEITAMDRAIGELRDGLGAGGVRDDTLLWYCGDNGTSNDAAATVKFRGVKGGIYDGGLRVPGLIEWPRVIREPRVSAMPAVTTDMLPTVCELAGVSLPKRTLDGISLRDLLHGKMTERPTPIGFWQWGATAAADAKPYLTTEQQTGTTPLTKIMGGKATRDFTNTVHPAIAEADFAGQRAWLDGRYKLVMDGQRKTPIELFDVVADPAEKTNLIAREPERVTAMQAALRRWQQSVLESLVGGDY
jgi:arylsulfatase A-like enzyme